MRLSDRLESKSKKFNRFVCNACVAEYAFDKLSHFKASQILLGVFKFPFDEYVVICINILVGPCVETKFTCDDLHASACVNFGP